MLRLRKYDRIFNVVATRITMLQMLIYLSVINNDLVVHSTHT